MPGKKQCFICLLLISLYTRAQSPAWLWAKYAASSGAEAARDVSYDAFSNSVYIGGMFNGNLSSVYGSTFSSTYGAKDGFLAKYDANGNLTWAIKVGGSGDDEIRGVANDPSGNVYISGYFKNTADFDPSPATFNLTSAGGQDGFLAKYSSSGTFMWAVKFGSNADEDCYKLFVDGNSAFVTGSYKSPATFYSTSSSTKSTTALYNGAEFFGARYNLNGVVQWVVSGAGDKEDEGFDVVADNNKVYFTGYYKNTFYINDVITNSVVAIQEPGGDKPNAFILAFTIAGNYAWSTNVASGDVDYGYGIAQDAGNIYVTGSIRQTANFKYPSPQFTQTIVGATDIFLAKIDKSNGNFLWANTQTGSGTGDEEPFAVETDAYGNIIITGYFKTSLNYSSYGGPSVTTSGGEDIFLTAYDASGNFLWMKQGIGSNPDFGRALSTSTTGAIYVAGEYGAGLTLDSYTLANTGASNIFVAKTGCEIISNNTISSSQTICAGSAPALLVGSIATGANSYTWQMSANSITWTTAPGSFTNQNYSSPTLTANTYFRRNASSGGACTMSTSPVVTITVDQPPSSSSAGISQTVCSSNATLSGNTPVVGSGSWSVISGLGSVTAVNNPSTQVTTLSVGANIFQWTISNGVCPVSASTVQVVRDMPPTPAAVTTPNQTLCTTTATLNANTPTTGSGAWSVISGSSTVSPPGSPSSVINNLSVGTNQFVWTISNGVCPSSSDTISIMRDDYPTIATAGNPQTICSLSTSLNGNNPLTGSGAWSVISGSATVSFLTNPNSPVNNLSVGQNQFVWTITNGSCPASSASVTIFRDDFPTTAVAGNSQSVCSTAATITANMPVVGIGMWSLLSGTAIIGSIQSPTTNVLGMATGSNKFKWTIVNGICPASSDSVFIQRDAEPDTAICGPDQHICGNTLTISANNPATGSGTWQLVNGNGTFNNPFASNTTISGLINGVTTLAWVVNNGICASKADTLIITADTPPPPANAGEDKTTCSPHTSLSAITPTAGSGYWTILSGSCVLGSPALGNSIVDSLVAGETILRWTVSNGICPISSDDVKITRDLPPGNAVAGEDKDTDIPVIELQAQNPVTGTGSWSVIQGSGSIDNPQNATIKISNLSIGENIFRWTVRNGVCPENADDIMVTLNPLKIPNAFSPNGDGVNDHFVIPGLDYYPNTAVHIFNRWGSEVYSSNDYKNNWNGYNSNNEELADDTYYYIIEASQKSYSGFLIIKHK